MFRFHLPNHLIICCASTNKDERSFITMIAKSCRCSYNSWNITKASCKYYENIGPKTDCDFQHLYTYRRSKNSTGANNDITFNEVFQLLCTFDESHNRLAHRLAGQYHFFVTYYYFIMYNSHIIPYHTVPYLNSTNQICKACVKLLNINK